MNKTDALIIGAGPTGLFTAHQLKLIGLDCEIVDNLDKIGGQCIELYPDKPIYDIPAVPECTGEELTNNLINQIKPFNIKTHLGERVDEVKKDGENWFVKTNLGKTFLTPNVIIAGGVGSFEPRKFPPKECEKFENKSIFYSVKDKTVFEGKTVSIFGGGDSACEEANFLTKFATTVHMFVRRDELRASKIMADRVLKNEKVKIHWNTELVDVLGEKEVTGVRIINNKTKEESDIALKGLFLAIGHTPNSSAFVEWLDHDENGYLVTKADSSKTNVEGVFACGDVQDHEYRQAVTAAGSGCMAAIDAERWLDAQGH